MWRDILLDICVEEITRALVLNTALVLNRPSALLAQIMVRDGSRMESGGGSADELCSTSSSDA